MKQKYSNQEIDRLILLISKLPGFGPKSAGRVVLHLLKRKDQLMKPLSEALLTASEKILNCTHVANVLQTVRKLSVRHPQTFCQCSLTFC